MLTADAAVDVNVQNKGGMGGHGMTPLMLAACVKARGKLDIFFTLLKHPKIDLTLKNDHKHTVYDIAVLEEIEFVLRPMTEVLKSKKCEVSEDLGVVKDFNKSNGVRWKDPHKTGVQAAVAGAQASAMQNAMAGMGGMGAAMGLPSGKEANTPWKGVCACVLVRHCARLTQMVSGVRDAHHLPHVSGLLTALPFYGDTLWLRKQVAYDLVAKQVLRKEWVRQKKDQAKMGSLLATMHSARILHMIKIGGSMAAAMKHAAKFALSSWMVYKACGLREYDVEYVGLQPHHGHIGSASHQDGPNIVFFFGRVVI